MEEEEPKDDKSNDVGCFSLIWIGVTAYISQNYVKMPWWGSLILMLTIPVIAILGVVITHLKGETK